MPPTHKRRAIEERLGEDLDGFIMRSIASGKPIRSIARKLGLAPPAVRYYRNRGRKQPVLSSVRRSRARMARIERGHVDICLCPWCRNECRGRTRSHGKGRCVIVCSNFIPKKKTYPQGQSDAHISA